MTISRSLFTSNDQNWATPDDLFAELNLAMHFTLDACAVKATAKCKRFVDPSRDGLNYSWNGERAFNNPPYSAVDLWMDKSRRESLNGSVLSANLVPARPDTGWWSKHVLSEDGEAGPLLKSLYDPANRTLWLRWRHLITGIYLHRGRLAFGGSTKSGKLESAPFPSAVIVQITPGFVLPSRRGLLERCPR